jgi:hypothetical protein
VPVALPETSLPPGHRQITFRWDYSDPNFTGRGDGVARVAPPDSVRLDFFLDGGVGGGGFAVVVGDSIFTPGGDQARRYLPPPALLWAALGRLAVPAVADTVARVDAGVLRVDIGRDPVWRATYSSNRLDRLERIAGGRIVEWVDRRDSSTVRYLNERARRNLTLSIRGTSRVSGFDEAIWAR